MPTRATGRKQQPDKHKKKLASPTASRQPKIVLSDHIKRNADFFRQLKAARGSAKRSRALVAEASNEQLLCLVECALNILRSRVPIRRQHLERLRHRANEVRSLSRVRSARTARRLLLLSQPAQTGGGIAPLVGLLASVLIPVLVDRVLEQPHQRRVE